MFPRLVPLTGGLLPEIIPICVTKYSFSETVLAHENKKGNVSTFISKVLEISKISGKSDWLVFERVQETYVVHFIKLNMRGKK
jgi:hypothetical protein